MWSIFTASALSVLNWQAAPPLLVQPLEPILRPMVLEIKRDPITDAMSAFATARSSDGRLSIGCDPDRYRGVRVAVRSQGWFASKKILKTTHIMPFRFDRRTAVEGNWRVKDNTATLRPTEQVVSFITAATAANRVTIRTRDIENREKDLTFSVLGGGPAIRRVLQICNAASR
jgi:hypothetical protein